MNATLALQEGINNLLINCMQVRPGDAIAIVREIGRCDYYSETLADVIAEHAKELGLNVAIEEAPVLEEVIEFPANIRAAMSMADHTLFLARIGDQLRFSDTREFGRITMCYALDEKSFETPFCSADYNFFRTLKNTVNSAVFGGKEITISCREGSHLVGVSPLVSDDDAQDEVSIRRFPVTVFRPVSCNTFSGRLALSKWICPTGSRFYRPDSVIIEGVVFANVENGRIVAFEGNRQEVKKIRAHYEYVSKRYSIDRDAIHSWHAGIHPQNGYADAAIDNLTRWAGSAFGNPRYLHLHSCGDYAPGEICISLFDPTVLADGAALWDGGKLALADTPEVRALMAAYPGIDALFEHPETEFGLREC